MKQKINKKHKVFNEQEEQIIATITDRMGNRVKLLYNMMQAADVIMNDLITGFQSFGTCFSQEKKFNYNKCMDALKNADHYYGQFADEDFQESAKVSGGYSKLDSYRKDANELVRYIMLYIDRAGNKESFKKIGELLESLPEGGIFPNEIIARYDFQKHGEAIL